MNYKDNRDKLNKIANTWGSTGNMEMDFMRNKIDEISKRPEEAAKSEAWGEYLSDPKSYIDWVHNTNAWAMRGVSKLPGAIPNAVGGIYDLGTGIVDTGINAGTYAYNRVKGTPNNWSYKDYTRPTNNWGYSLGGWLNDKIGRPVTNNLFAPLKAVDYVTTAPELKENWKYRDLPQYSKSLQESDPFGVMGILEDVAAESAVGAGLAKYLNPIKYKRLNSVLADSGLKLKDYDIVGSVEHPVGRPGTYIRANRHVRNPDRLRNMTNATTAGSFTNGDFLWAAPSSRASRAYKFGGSEPLLPSGNKTFQIATDPRTFGSPLFLLDDTNIQKWPNGSPVVTKDLMYIPHANRIKLAKHRHPIVRGDVYGYSQGWEDSRKALAIEQNLQPRKNNIFYKAIEDKNLANSVGLDDASFNKLEVVRNPSANAEDVIDAFIPPRFVFDRGEPLADSMVNYLHLVRKGKKSLSAAEDIPLTFLKPSQRVQDLTKILVGAEAANSIPEYLRRR